MDWGNFWVQLSVVLYCLGCMRVGYGLINSCTDVFYRKTWIRTSLGVAFVPLSPVWLTILAMGYCGLMGLVFLGIGVANFRIWLRRKLGRPTHLDA
jgi:hypothetical protein